MHNHMISCLQMSQSRVGEKANPGEGLQATLNCPKTFFGNICDA